MARLTSFDKASWRKVNIVSIRPWALTCIRKFGDKHFDASSSALKHLVETSWDGFKPSSK